MKNLTLEVKLLEGFGELDFGIAPEKVIEFLGNPDEKETFEVPDEGDVEVYHYWKKGISLFFENPENPALANFETDNEDATLFGRKIFEMNEENIISLMKENGYSEMDVEMMDDEEFENEKRVSFDDALVDLFFEDGILMTISWGLILDEDEIIEG